MCGPNSYQKPDFVDPGDLQDKDVDCHPFAVFPLFGRDANFRGLAQGLGGAPNPLGRGNAGIEVHPAILDIHAAHRPARSGHVDVFSRLPFAPLHNHSLKNSPSGKYGKRDDQT